MFKRSWDSKVYFVILVIPDSFGKVEVVNTMMCSIIFNAFFIKNLVSLFFATKYLKTCDRYIEFMKAITKERKDNVQAQAPG